MLYLGADHRGFQLKEEIKRFLSERGVVFEDLGNSEYDRDDDFPIFAKRTAEKVVGSDKNKGVLICGSGIGMSISANRFKNIRAGLCPTKEMAVAGRSDDDINILILPADFVDLEQAKDIINSFLNTDFSNKERYIRRIKMIDN